MNCSFLSFTHSHTWRFFLLSRQPCSWLAFGTTCRFFPACICSNVCCQTANHTRQAGAKMKRGVKTATICPCPWLLQTLLVFTVEVLVPGWQQLLPVWTCLSTIFFQPEMTDNIHHPLCTVSAHNDVTDVCGWAENLVWCHAVNHAQLS